MPPSPLRDRALACRFARRFLAFLAFALLFCAAAAEASGLPAAANRIVSYDISVTLDAEKKELTDDLKAALKSAIEEFQAIFAKGSGT